MKTLLICHADAPHDREILPRWLASFSDLRGVLLLDEPARNRLARLRREWRRSGLLGLVDVLAFRLYHRLAYAASARRAETALLERLRQEFPSPSAAPQSVVPSPNCEAARNFIAAAEPDIMIARCKTLLKPDIYRLARDGTFALHPGYCPEYRNAHGCFWALAHDDLDKVGLTVLKIDAGVDTGPIIGQFPVAFDELRESPLTIQLRALYDNLPAVRQALEAYHDGTAQPLDVAGRPSAVWGQPRLSAYRRWQRAARRRAAS